jgi:hypothetical protein
MKADNDDLRRKIDEAKLRLPLPQLLERLGLGAHAKKSGRCPFAGHEDKHPSFSVFLGNDGFWHWTCFAGCGGGDEIMFLSKLKRVSLSEAINLYLSMAGFPNGAPPKSHEYPESPQSPQSHRSHGSPESPEWPKSPKSPVFPVYPVSNGHGLDGQTEKVLKALAARNACTERNTARKRRWKLVRDLRALEKGIGRELTTGELMPVFDEWHRLSQPFLDPAKTREDYLAMFLAELTKVRVPTGEGETIKKALECVLKLPASELPQIPGMPDAPESWRRLVALHRELSRLCVGKTYFLSCRDAARAHHSFSYQLAASINLALARLGVIKIVRTGYQHLNGKASEFRYLLLQTGNGANQSEDATSQAESSSW